MKSLIKYEPSYLNMFEDFDRVFDSFLDNGWFGRTRVPAVDVREENDRYVLEAEMTGLSEKDVDVKVQDNLLMISSKKEENSETKKSGYLLRERRSSAFRSQLFRSRPSFLSRSWSSVSSGAIAGHLLTWITLK